MSKLILLLSFVSLSVYASEAKTFMYKDVVSFHDDFYGDCIGTIIEKGIALSPSYYISSRCSTSQEVVRELLVDAKSLTLIKRK